MLSFHFLYVRFPAEFVVKNLCLDSSMFENSGVSVVKNSYHLYPNNLADYIAISINLLYVLLSYLCCIFY